MGVLHLALLPLPYLRSAYRQKDTAMGELISDIKRPPAGLLAPNTTYPILALNVTIRSSPLLQAIAFHNA